MSRDQTPCPSSFHIDTDSVGYALRLNPTSRLFRYYIMWSDMCSVLFCFVLFCLSCSSSALIKRIVACAEYNCGYVL